MRVINKAVHGTVRTSMQHRALLQCTVQVHSLSYWFLETFKLSMRQKLRRITFSAGFALPNTNAILLCETFLQKSNVKLLCGRNNSLIDDDAKFIKFLLRFFQNQLSISLVIKFGIIEYRNNFVSDKTFFQTKHALYTPVLDVNRGSSDFLHSMRLAIYKIEDSKHLFTRLACLEHFAHCSKNPAPSEKPHDRPTYSFFRLNTFCAHLSGSNL